MCDSTDPIRTAFAARLERVRGTRTPDDFERLVEDMVTTGHRLDEIETCALGSRTRYTHHTVDGAGCRALLFDVRRTLVLVSTRRGDELAAEGYLVSSLGLAGRTVACRRVSAH